MLGVVLGRHGGSSFVIQVGAGVASEAAWRLSACVCVPISARDVRVFQSGERSDPGAQQTRRERARSPAGRR